MKKKNFTNEQIGYARRTAPRVREGAELICRKTLKRENRRLTQTEAALYSPGSLSPAEGQPFQAPAETSKEPGF